MISLLNFIDTGFMITLGLLILVSGGIMLYCYRRLNLLENSIIEHGKILQNFIVNYNNQIMINQQVLNNSPQANVQNTPDNIKVEDKIVVSDNESNVSDSDSDSNVSDNEHESEESENESEEYSSNESENEENDKKEVLHLESKEVLEETNDNDAFLNNLPIDLNQLDLKLDSKIIKLESLENENNETNENNDKTTNEKKNYSRMKVDELRTLVVTKNLTSNEDAQTMKKNDLLKLLQ
jgi:hypothetical protein